MKSDNAAMPKSKQNKNTPGNNSSGDNNKKNKVAFSDPNANPVEKAKVRSGRGLANEGTIVSYDEER